MMHPPPLPLAVSLAVLAVGGVVDAAGADPMALIPGGWLAVGAGAVAAVWRLGGELSRGVQVRHQVSQESTAWVEATIARAMLDRSREAQRLEATSREVAGALDQLRTCVTELPDPIRHQIARDYPRTVSAMDRAREATRGVDRG